MKSQNDVVTLAPKMLVDAELVSNKTLIRMPTPNVAQYPVIWSNRRVSQVPWCLSDGLQGTSQTQPSMRSGNVFEHVL